MYIIEWILFLVLFFLVLFCGFESTSCAETSRVGLLLLLFFFSITAWKFMKSRQIFVIHFFSVLLQLSWWCVIGNPFLNSQCSNRSAAQLDVNYI